MPELLWNEEDFLECFGVEPKTEEYATSHCYEIIRNGLRLQFMLWQFESVIQTAVYRDESSTPLFSLAAFVRGEARFIQDKRGRFLQFEDCILTPNRFGYRETGNAFDRNRFPASLTVTVAVDPDIRISFESFASRT